MRDLLPQALGYAARGWRVVPLHTPNGSRCDCGRPTCRLPDPNQTTSMGKHPRINNWVVNASADLDTVTEWWTRWPQANIGLATGRTSGVVVLDVDPRNGGLDEILRLASEHDWGHDGPIVATGGGGWHYYFAAPDVEITNNHPFPGIDFQADGMQVVLPPSVHYTGVSYQWTENGPDLPLPAVPDWLLAACTTRAARAKSTAAGAVIGQGGRNDWLASVGGSLRAKGCAESVIFAALMAENDERCNPPLDRTEVAQIAASVARYEPSEGIPVLGAGPAARGSEKAPRYTPQPFSAADLQYEVLPEMRWAVPGLIAEGLGVCAGRAKLGKSWLMLHVGMAVAEGDVALGEFPVEDGDVLYLALEDNKRRLQERLRKMAPEGEWPARLFLETQWPRSEDGGMEALAAFIGQHPYLRIVIIDTLVRFKTPAKGRRGNAYEEDADWAIPLQRLALDHKIAIIVVTHLNKSLHDDWVDKISGSIGMPGVSDTLMLLDRQRGVEGQNDARLRLTGRDIEEQDYKVKFDGATGLWAIAGEWTSATVSRERDDLLAVMAKIGNPVTPEDIAAAMGKTRPAAYKALYRAALDGQVVSHKGKLFTLPNLEGENSPENADKSSLQGPLSASFVREHTPLPTDEDSNAYDSRRTAMPAKGLISFSPTPGDPCGQCGETNWLRRAAGGFVCGTCKPWLKTLDIAEKQA